MVSFYDPNRAGSLVRMAETVSSGLTNLRSLNTEDLLGKEAHDFYFKDANSAMLIPIDREKLATVMSCVSKDVPVQLAVPDKIEVDESVDTLHPHFIFHLMNGKFHQNVSQFVRDLKALELDKTDMERLVKIVEAYGGFQDDYALFAALQDETSLSSVAAYADVFSLIPENRRADLLIKITGSKFSHCLALGRPECLRAYKFLLDLVPAKDRRKVLVAISNEPVAASMTNPDGATIDSMQSGLVLALDNEEHDAILAYAELAASLSEALPIAVLPDPPTFQAAMQLTLKTNDISMFKACLALLKLVSPEQRRTRWNFWWIIWRTDSRAR